MFPFDRDGLKEKLNEINKKTEAEDFWKDQETAQKLLKEKKAIEVKLQEYSRLEEEFSDVETLILMAEEEDDESLLPDIDYAKAFSDYLLSHGMTLQQIDALVQALTVNQ